MRVARTNRADSKIRLRAARRSARRVATCAGRRAGMSAVAAVTAMAAATMTLGYRDRRRERNERQKRRRRCDFERTRHRQFP